MTCANAGNPAQWSARFAALLPRGVATAELVGPGDPLLLPAEERRLLARPLPERAAEFAAGRLCARSAAARFGGEVPPIGRRADRRPLWPESLTGSITHTEGFTAAAVGERRRFRAIGIDVERIGAVTPDLWSLVLTAAESVWVGRLPAATQSTAATLLYSAKETFYKCQFEATQQSLEFADVAVECLGQELPPGRLTLKRVGGHGGSSATVHFAVTPHFLLTAMTLPVS